MTHPTKAQVQIVIDNLTRILPEAEKWGGHLDMMETQACGTTMCHAGWYLVSVKGILPNETFLAGTDLMAKHLGFVYDFDLREWAYANPIVWGNTYGRGIFSEPTAFTPKGKHQAETLRDIVDHWTEVRDRLPA